MEPSEHLSAVADASRRLVAAATGSLDAPVRTCPGWDVEALVTHVGRVWGWAAAVVESGEQAERPPVPEREGLLLEWAQAQAARLLSALGDADPGSACWTFGPDRTRRFWFRRQALESTLHAWDAEDATGAPATIDPALAADGVDELLTAMLPRRNPGTWGGETLHLHRTDGDGEWLVTLGPADHVSAERAHGKGDVALRGPAEGLWLWSTNRRTPEEASLEVLGDRAVADRWAAEISF